MKFLSVETLGPHRHKTSQGYLVCTDAIIARTGKQEYKNNELFEDSEDDETIVSVDRPYDEVFSPETMASFENCALVDEHPDEDVTVENHRDLSMGYMRDIHKGQDDGQDVLMANIVVTDPEVIAEIESGKKTELSCGYDCQIMKDAKGNYFQHKIRGNHLALCESGRAGNARIQDSNEEFNKVTEKNLDNTLKKDIDELKKKNPNASVDAIVNELFYKKQYDYIISKKEFIEKVKKFQDSKMKDDVKIIKGYKMPDMKDFDKHILKGSLEIWLKDGNVVAYYDEKKDETHINTKYIHDSIQDAFQDDIVYKGEEFVIVKSIDNNNREVYSLWFKHGGRYSPTTKIVKSIKEGIEYMKNYYGKDSINDDVTEDYTTFLRRIKQCKNRDEVDEILDKAYDVLSKDEYFKLERWTNANIKDNKLMMKDGDSKNEAEVEKLINEENEAVESYENALSNTKEHHKKEVYNHILGEELEHINELEHIDDAEDRPVKVRIRFENNKEANDALRMLQKKEDYLDSDLIFDDTIQVKTSKMLIDNLKKLLKLYFVEDIKVMNDSIKDANHKKEIKKKNLHYEGYVDGKFIVSGDTYNEVDNDLNEYLKGHTYWVDYRTNDDKYNEKREIVQALTEDEAIKYVKNKIGKNLVSIYNVVAKDANEKYVVEYEYDGHKEKEVVFASSESNAELSIVQSYSPREQQYVRILKTYKAKDSKVKDWSMKYQGHTIEEVFFSYYDDGHYSVDGNNDKRECFDTLEEAKAYIRSLKKRDSKSKEHKINKIIDALQRMHVKDEKKRFEITRIGEGLKGDQTTIVLAENEQDAKKVFARTYSNMTNKKQIKTIKEVKDSKVKDSVVKISSNDFGVARMYGPTTIEQIEKLANMKEKIYLEQDYAGKTHGFWKAASIILKQLKTGQAKLYN